MLGARVPARIERERVAGSAGFQPAFCLCRQDVCAPQQPVHL